MIRYTTCKACITCKHTAADVLIQIRGNKLLKNCFEKMQYS